MNMSDKIIKHRKANGWSQEDFAEKLNVSRQAISRWENGTALPDAQNILQISKLFHVTTDYLLNEDYESDRDIPVVKTAEQEAETLFVKKKHLHLVSAICFAVAWFCALMGVLVQIAFLDALSNRCLWILLCWVAMLPIERSGQRGNNYEKVAS